MKILKAAVFVGLMLTIPAVLAQSSNSPQPSTPQWPTHGWPKGTPAAVGLDEKVLSAFDADLAGGKYYLVDSLTVIRCGTEVFEKTYSHDYATIYGKEAKTRGPLNARLIALTRGDFKASLDTPLLKYFDVAKVKNVDARKRRITLRHVLTMTTGLDWNEEVAYDDPKNDSSLMEASDDWVQYVIDRPMAQEPGKVFNYSSGVSMFLAYVFQKETGQDIEKYGEMYLFTPLGMKHFWKRTPLGVVDTEGGLFLSGPDLAKLGYLYLRDGMWDGKQVVSKEWVRESLTPFIDAEEGFKYGFK